MRPTLRLAALLLLVACDKPSPDPSLAPAPSSSAAVVPVASSSDPAPSATPVASSPPTPPDAIIAQHVLVAYKSAKRAPKGVTRSKEEAKARAREACDKVRAGTPFEDVVKQYSDDLGSADRMGSLGKFRRDAMDPAFSKAAFGLAVGQVSDPVETPFGFHVIKRTQ
jgi:peptidyl-prolyl cis-trans isomerase NIMA-interacting 1